MLGDQRTHFNNYVDIKEFLALYEKHTTTEAMVIANEVFDLWCARCRRSGDSKFDFVLGLGAVYEAGRIQGIREERRKKSLAQAVRSTNARD